MLKLVGYIFLVIAIFIYMISVTDAKKKEKRKIKFGPKGMSLNYSTSCKEFSKNARFSPYSVLNEKWFVFFYWAPPTPLQIFHFTFPSANDTKFLHKMFDGKVSLAVDWSARQILMQDKNKVTSLLVERSDRGHYWQYMLHKVKDKLIEPRDVRLKQVDVGHLLGFMDCRSEIVYVMSRINEVPPKTRIQDEAAKLGYRGRRGKSYLYQGHEWMPVPEADERLFWARSQSEESETNSKESGEERIGEDSVSSERVDFKSLNGTKEFNSIDEPKETSSSNNSNAQSPVNENRIDKFQESQFTSKTSLDDTKFIKTVDIEQPTTDLNKTELIELQSVDNIAPKRIIDIKEPEYKYTDDLEYINSDKTLHTTDKIKHTENTTKQDQNEVTEIVTYKIDDKISSTMSIQNTNKESITKLEEKNEDEKSKSVINPESTKSNHVEEENRTDAQLNASIASIDWQLISDEGDR